ncbi:hypothetical protein BDV10DRAFT_191872 [Aspergillus recurvatus]
MRMALVYDCSSTAAVLRALFALSSVHRSGLQSQVVDLKMSAIRDLITTNVPKGDIGSMKAALHVATDMLLCSFKAIQIQIQRASCTSGQWANCLIGAKRITKTSTLESLNEFGFLVDWVYYHGVLSHFSAIHWHPTTAGLDSPSSEASADVREEIVYFTFCRLPPITLSVYKATMALLADVCDTVSTQSPDIVLINDQEDRRNFSLKTLGFRIHNITSWTFRLAMTENRIQNAFTTSAQIIMCERQFPLFILGCEARTEHERSTILDLNTRTEEQASFRSLYLLRKIIEAIWI